jgi:serine protease AprX
VTYRFLVKRLADIWRGSNLNRNSRFLPIVSLLLILISSPSCLSQQLIEGSTRFEYPTEVPKVDLKTGRLLKALPSHSSVTVWVLFKDKGIESSAQYRQALDAFSNQLSERSIRRRMMRGAVPGLDFTDLPVKNEYLNQLKDMGVKIRVVSRWQNAASVVANREQIRKIENLPFIRGIKKVALFTRREPQFQKEQWRGFHKPGGGQVLGYGKSYAQLEQIHVPDFHRIGITGAGVLITILDTGFFTDHPAFEHILNSGRLIATRDFINGDEDVGDADTSQGSHGTSVWSAVGGFAEDTLIGCAYGAQFALAKTEIDAVEDTIEEDYWVAGVEWADSLGADVVSSSLGYTDWYTYEDMDGNTAVCTQAADLAVSKGIVVVNAAGNERPYAWHYIIAPADGDSVIAAGAVDLNGNIASFSSAGPTYDGRTKPDVCARGVGVYCASVYVGYYYFDGTSYATPLVAGACALLLEANPDWNPIQVREALWTTASQADNPDTLYGYGIVNASKASGFSYLVISPQKLDFEATFGDTQSHRTTLEIIDWRGKNLKWSASTNADWVSLLPESGITSDLMWVTVDPSHLKAGINSDSIFIFADSAINSPEKVQVNFTLHPHVRILAFPNPFKDNLTLILEQLSPEEKIKISVFTVAGELVYRFPERLEGEIYQVTWDGKNDKGEELASGIYLLKVDIGDHSEIMKVAKVD